MDRIGVLYHPILASAHPLAEEIEGKLKELGVAQVWLASAWDESSIAAQAPGSRMVITLGGDGTILRAARRIAPLGVPILAVNLGKLGFMSELSPEDVFDKLPLYLQGKAWVEERLMLHAELETSARSLTGTSADGQVVLEPNSPFDALNDIVVARGNRVRVINVTVSVDGEKGPSFVADGVIVATPTGSTGYSLSAGGPVLHPELQSVIVTPIAPHLSVNRALVLPSTVTVELDITTDHGATLSIDGQIDVPLQSGDRVKISRSRWVAKLLRAEPGSYFYRTLAVRLR